jgi:lipopolysaccharide biosynthesis regulator YciM
LYQLFYEKALSHSQNKNEAMLKISILYTEMKEYSKAINILNQLETDDSTTVYLQLAKIYKELNDINKYKFYADKAAKKDSEILHK